MHQKNISSIIFLSLILLFSFTTSLTFAQNAPSQKKMWAQSFLGQKAPTIEVEGWIQEPVNMEGKYVLVDIWATWCGPCRRVIPEMNEWQEKFKDKLVVIGISSETREKVEAYAIKHIKYPNGYDTKSRVKSALKSNRYSTCYPY